jgi:hypothetical protein
MWLVSVVGAAWGAGCLKTSVGELSQVPSPSVLVLGERRGTLPDLSRAAAIVGKLAGRGPVTVALQAVDREFQPVLVDWSAGRTPLEQLPAAVEWNDRWGFPFDAYAKLLGARDDGARFVAIGGKVTLKPKDATLQLPPGYMAVLADAMGDSPVPVELETSTLETMAFTDQGLASAALAAWDGEGVLVIVVDRLHVEGGLGVAWQAQRLTDVPVTAALLAHADTRCYTGDRFLP